jgi:hypothetical protein
MYLPKYPASTSQGTPQQPWYDIPAFDRLVKEHDHYLCLCKRIVDRQIDYAHGIPQKEIYVCTDKVVGFVEVQSMAQLSVDGGKGGIVRASELYVNLLPRYGFHQGKVTKDTRLLFEGVYYQMHLTDEPSNIHRGNLVFYQYKLVNAHKGTIEGPQLQPKMVGPEEFFALP